MTNSTCRGPPAKAIDFRDQTLPARRRQKQLNQQRIDVAKAEAEAVEKLLTAQLLGVKDQFSQLLGALTLLLGLAAFGGWMAAWGDYHHHVGDRAQAKECWSHAVSEWQAMKDDGMLDWHGQRALADTRAKLGALGGGPDAAPEG